MEILNTTPTHDQYTSLAVHQSQTPTSFYEGPPILYHQCSSYAININSLDLASSPAFARLAEGAPSALNGSTRANGHIAEPEVANSDASSALNGDIAHEASGEHDDGEEEEQDQGEDVRISNVDIWVTSERFILFLPTRNIGLSIPYPSISLHAIQRPTAPASPALFLQILPSTTTFDDHDPDASISLTLTPSDSSTAGTATVIDTDESGSRREGDEIDRLFGALSACANLHPDPLSQGDEDDDDEDMDATRGGGTRRMGQQPAIIFEGDAAAADGDGGAAMYTSIDGSGAGGALPPPMPGSGGWITAENVGQFFDDEGNWRGRGGDAGQAAGLGEGAGRIRSRGEGDLNGDTEGTDADGDGVIDDGKWRRTS